MTPTLQELITDIPFLNKRVRQQNEYQEELIDRLCKGEIDQARYDFLHDSAELVKEYLWTKIKQAEIE